jgi:hypothetical protein
MASGLGHSTPLWAVIQYISTDQWWNDGQQWQTEESSIALATRDPPLTLPQLWQNAISEVTIFVQFYITVLQT